MAASLNGMAAHGGIIPFGSTFLMFSDYMRPAIRLAALMELGVIYVFTHDSIGVGEDGPTHQPIEQVAALRAIPQLTVIRPGDANETAVARRVSRRISPRAGGSGVDTAKCSRLSIGINSPPPRGCDGALTFWPTRRAAIPISS